MTSYDSHFTSSYDAVFFASSGDNGSFQEVNWPACSPNVVAVGGTTLNLNTDGTVISETAWSGSGGGVSAYEPQPDFQTSFGLSYSKRAVPDVSYDGEPAGVAVYSTVLRVDGFCGGTSAGHLSGRQFRLLGFQQQTLIFMASKIGVLFVFRDITSGSNGYSADSRLRFGYRIRQPIDR